MAAATERGGQFKRRRMRRHRCAFDPVGDPAAVVAYIAGEFSQRALGRLGVARHTGIVDAGRHHRNADDPFQGFVKGRADDNVGILVDLLANAR